MGALIAAGFREEAELYVLPADTPSDSLRTALQEVQSHAEAKKMEHLRAERDAKIAKAKAEEAELAKFGGFARGIHKLGGSGTASSAPSLTAPVIDALFMDDPRRSG